MADIEVCGIKFTFNDNGQGFAFDVNFTDKNGIKRLSVGMDFRGKKQPKKVSLSWTLPAIRPDDVWSTCGEMNRRLTPDWEPYTLSARSASEYPVLSVLSFDDIDCDDERSYAVEDCYGKYISSEHASRLKIISVPVGGMLIL